MNKDRIINVHREVVKEVDFTTGEMVNVQQTSVKILVDPNEFALIYASFWDVIIGSNLSKADIDLLSYLIQNYAEGIYFSISSDVKRILASRTGKSPTSYNNSPRNLIKAGFIYQTGQSRSYRLNPRYAYQGSSHERNKAVIEMLGTCPAC